MQKKLKFLFSLGLALLLLCVMPACVMDGSSLSNPLILASEEPPKDRKRSRRGSDAGGKCDEDGDCAEICEDVYDPDGDDKNNGLVDRCLDLSYRTAIQFEEIIETLEEPYDSNLRNIKPAAFKSFLDVSVGPWVKEVEGASNAQDKILLTWIARDKAISKAIVKGFENFESEYSQYEGIKDMLEDLAPSVSSGNSEVKKCAEMCKAITEVGILGTGTSPFWSIVTQSNTKNCDGQKIVAQILYDTCQGEGVPDDDPGLIRRCPAWITSTSPYVYITNARNDCI